jgi:endonuclease YncB( thermonuclease family)
MDATVLAAGGVFLASLGTASFLGLRLLRRGAASALPGRTREEARLQPLSSFEGRIYVIDGDTVEVRRQRIRLFGIDAPELSQKGGDRARSHLIRIAGRRKVRVEPVTVDCYGRIVARLFDGDADLSAKIVSDGYAVAMSRWHPDYVGQEAEARRSGRGLWAGGGISDPAAHRRWRARIG